MNKRIKKKRMKLRDMRIGDHIYTRKEIMFINKAHIGYMNMRLLYQQIKKPKLTRPRIMSLINYIYKSRTKQSKRMFKYLRFARRVTANDIVNYRTSIPKVSGGSEMGVD